MKFFRNIMKKIKDKREKYDVKPEKNIPREVYGVPTPKKDEDKYNIRVEENIPQRVYGVPDYFKTHEKTTISENSFDKALTNIVGNNPFWSELIKKFFNEDFKCDEATAIDLLKKVSADRQIFNEFFKYLYKKTYDIENAINIDGVTAKELANANPEKSAIEIYIMLGELNNKK